MTLAHATFFLQLSDSKPESSASRRRVDAASKSIEDHYRDHTLDKASTMHLFIMHIMQLVF